MPRRENLSEDQISKTLLKLDEEWEEDSSDSSEGDGERSSEVIRKWINVDGHVVYRDKRKEIDPFELKKFMGLIILIGVYKS
ncbi:Hypothetical predicted protein [Octopus vulgaris]|uniref:Uncharacterized protein n=1 Tax=Octopus vulgaris TaxID=6645 RepID=A0AA36ALN1_OCTVU|nr:Hypothetical predicted protein [Octopus vulgaris]